MDGAVCDETWHMYAVVHITNECKLPLFVMFRCVKEQENLT